MKNLLITLLIIFSIFSLNAQDTITTKKNTFDFGIRHGWRHSTTNRGYDRADNINLYVGLFVETDISERFTLRLETNHSRFGLLEVPLLLKYKISDKFELLGGGEIDYFYDNNQFFSDKKEFGGAFILGVQYNINSHWFIEARYTHGFTDQFPVFYYNDDFVFGKKRIVSFGLGYQF